ncbi:MFS general substrate transporter [Suillus cothurnatus]|nr:MFS general substrate transporter [Suillus cothurnatus]
MAEKLPSYIESLKETGVTFDQEIPNELASNQDLSPDGGIRAWLAVFATTLVTFSTFGFLTSWGVFQAYYEENLLPDTLPSTIAWIGSTQYALVCLPSLATGRLFDLGYFKVPFFAASCVLVTCTFLTAECTKFWQLFLTQGIGLGVGCGFVFSPAIVIVSHWFSKRRSLALSITAVGSALGSIVFPVAAQNLIPLIGYNGTANIFLKRRLPPVSVRGGLFNLKEFRNKAYSTYCIAGTMILLGFYTELTYISVSAVAIGVSKDFSFYIIAIANAASAFGRVSSGLLGDQIGRRTQLPLQSSLLLRESRQSLGHLLKMNPKLIAIATIHGFSIGGYISLYSVPAVAMGKMEDAGRRVGMFVSLTGLGSIAGPPISGAICTATGGFVDCGIMFGVALLLVAWYFHLRRLWGKF